MSKPITTIEDFAREVRAMRMYQNQYFRIPKENNDARQTALRKSKHQEGVVDKLVSEILEPKIF